jgi:hypothetical protein
MANEEQLSILKQGVEIWNNWRKENLNVVIDLSKTSLKRRNLQKAVLHGADLSGTDFSESSLAWADLSEANLFEANLYVADLYQTDLRGANLVDAILVGAQMILTKIEKAKVSGSSIYSINVWDTEGEFEEEHNLVITDRGNPVITVDDIEVAQFVYLLLNNQKIRNVSNTLTSKTVLILSRFSIPERKAILDAIGNKLREYNLLPIVFDFDRPTDKDFTETIKTLAGVCYFVIADITNPKSSPLELHATVPDYQIPFVPIIQEGESPFAMMAYLQTKYNWVLDMLSHKSIDDLIKALKPAIIDPASKSIMNFGSSRRESQRSGQQVILFRIRGWDNRLMSLRAAAKQSPRNKEVVSPWHHSTASRSSQCQG